MFSTATHASWLAAGAILCAACGCERQKATPSDAQVGTPAAAPPSSASAVPAAASRLPSKPGTATVHGSVFHGGAPLAGIEVQLCRKFFRTVRACEGERITAVTDIAGSYSFTNVEPGVYPAAVALAFDMPHVIWDEPRSLSDQASFAPRLQAVAHDLRLIRPAPDRQTNTDDPPTFEWAAYPGAAYYDLRVEHLAGTGDIVLREEVRATTFRSSKPIGWGTYVWSVTAFDEKRRPLAQNKGPNDSGWTFFIRR